ncbi:MAG: DUF2452 domain-containing protein [Bacteroidota bacterium]|nr:DUF2452 domain-containing protein [Bacteroidota bacterium]
MNNNPNKVNLDHFDLEKEKDKISETPGLIPFPHHIGGAAIKLEDRGKIKGRAMAAMKEQSEKQMNQLYEQMQVLAKQANEIKNRVEVSSRIYNSQINFEPIIGHSYYLYEKQGENDVLSMIGPNQWGKKIPFKKFIAQVKLLSDHTWEILDHEDSF